MVSPRRSGSRAAANTRGQKRVRAARRRMYRELILEAAEAVFARAGFPDAKMQEVALEAGISLKTLYAHFRGKSELFACVQSERVGEIIERARSLRQNASSAEDELLDMVALGVGFLLARPDFLRIQLREGSAWAVRPSGDAGDETDLWHRGILLQAEVFRRGIDEGVFVDEDPELLARTLTAIYQVQLADWLEREPDGDPAALVRRIQAFVRRAFFRRSARARELDTGR